MSNGSVDRDYDDNDNNNEDSNQIVTQTDDSELFKDCNVIESESSLIMKKLMNMMTLIQTDMHEMRKEMKGEVTDIKKRLEQVEQNVKEEVKVKIEVIDKKVDTFFDWLEQNENQVNDLKLRVIQEEQKTENNSTEINEMKLILQ